MPAAALMYKRNPAIGKGRARHLLQSLLQKAPDLFSDTGCARLGRSLNGTLEEACSLG
jgi:hypothetical protein